MSRVTEWARRIEAKPSFDIGILILIVISILLLAAEVALPEKHPDFDTVVKIGDVITGIFILELVLRLIASRRRSRFFREYFIDILAVLPVFRAFRMLRFLRLFRLLRLFRAVSLVARQTRVLHWLLRQRVTEYLLTSVLIISATVFCTLGLAHFRRPVESGIDVLSNSFWQTIFSLIAGEYITEFPDSLGGKLVILFVQFCGVTFFALLTGTISAVMIEKLKEGTVLNRLMLEDLENHIIICGWNAGVQTIITEFQSHPELKDREIVIITERTDRPALEIPDSTKVRLLTEDFTRAEVLQRCNVNSCSVAVIVSDISGGRSRQDADARTVLAALTIEKMNPDVHTCAELSNSVNESHLRMGGVNEVIVTRSISGHLLAQAALYSANVHLLQELLRPTQGHTLKPTLAEKEDVGKTFSELLPIHHQRTGNILLAVEGADGQIVVNPNKYTIKEGDKLICVAYHSG